ncbi:MAG: ATP-dependent sacrificial sulfur transferase LarE [Candidatus Bathyarchaeia archaeon]
MKHLDEKYEDLKKFIAEKGKNGVLIALSGGVDSSTLAAVCHNVLGEKAVAVTLKSPVYPSEEIEEAKRIAQKISIKHYVVEVDQLSNENFVNNPENRCYYCKKEMMECLQKFAQKLGLKTIFEGTNFSDLSGHRPGFEAIKESGNVICPWVAKEFAKEEIRALARKLGLPFYDKPAMACLASRISFGERITREKLYRVEEAERIVRELSGVRQLRVRDHGGLARIEVGKDERHLLFDAEVMDKIAEKLKRLGFKFVTLDLEGYRAGSMLAAMKQERKPPTIKTAEN